MRTSDDKLPFLVPSFNDAALLCRAGVTPLKLSEQIFFGFDYIAKKNKLTTRRAAGLCVYYGIVSEGKAVEMLSDD